MNKKYLFVFCTTIVFPFICLGQIKVAVDFDKYLKEVVWDASSKNQVNESKMENLDSTHMAYDQIKNLAERKIVTVISIGPRGNAGSGVFLGLVNYSKDIEGNLHFSKEKTKDTNEYIAIATNYHVAGVSPMTSIAFKNSNYTTMVAQDNKFCSSHKDICLLLIDVKDLFDESLKSEILKEESFYQQSLEMIPSKELKQKDDLIYIGYVLKNCFYSKGSIFSKYNDDQYFNHVRNETEKSSPAVMLSTDSLFKQGMSGGGVFNNKGQLIGIISFFNVIKNPLYTGEDLGSEKSHIMGSFFLPTEWVTDIVYNPSAFKFGLQTNKAPFWLRDSPSFLSELNKVE